MGIIQRTRTLPALQSLQKRQCPKCILPFKLEHQTLKNSYIIKLKFFPALTSRNVYQNKLTNFVSDGRSRSTNICNLISPIPFRLLPSYRNNVPLLYIFQSTRVIREISDHKIKGQWLGMGGPGPGAGPASKLLCDPEQVTLHTSPHHSHLRNEGHTSAF